MSRGMVLALVSVAAWITLVYLIRRQLAERQRRREEMDG